MLRDRSALCNPAGGEVEQFLFGRRGAGFSIAQLTFEHAQW
jgi:hypothetical protein